mmetsp:Transcript_9060/g.13535  ORF Transcript_9060/g.13535 Transcript_9060/m.13535 type:complete len:82 (-) Transcript_9060:42-287(-)
MSTMHSGISNTCYNHKCFRRSDIASKLLIFQLIFSQPFSIIKYCSVALVESRQSLMSMNRFIIGWMFYFFIGLVCVGWCVD